MVVVGKTTFTNVVLDSLKTNRIVTAVLSSNISLLASKLNLWLNNICYKHLSKVYDHSNFDSIYL